MKQERCPTCNRRQPRSNEANKRYWALLNEISEKLLPEKQKYAPETWHHYFKQKVLGATDIKLPNGKTYTQPNSTTELDVSEFNDYMTTIEAWAAEKGVYLPE